MGKIKIQDDDIDAIQDDIIKTIKNKRAKQVKERKTYTLGQIIKALAVALALMSFGAYAGITLNGIYQRAIDAQVKEQVEERLDQLYIIEKE